MTSNVLQRIKLLLLWIMSVSTSVSRAALMHHGDCDDLQTIDILATLIPQVGKLPGGTSLIYDSESHAHAWTFSNEKLNVQYPSEKVFNQCNIFPEEFSVFLTLYLDDTVSERQCIIRIFRRKKTLFSVCVKRRTFIIVYENRQVKFRNVKYLNNTWNSVSIGVTGSDVFLSLNCYGRKRQRLKRQFPANIPLDNSTIQLGSRQQNRHIFQGQLKNIIFSPGADVSLRACPARIENHVHSDNNLPYYPDIGNVYGPGPDWGGCRWMDVGHLAFDLYSSSLKVCVNGVWRHLETEPQPNKYIPQKLDYLEEYQTIRTFGQTLDAEVFTIPDFGRFVVFANVAKNRKNTSVLYRWVGGKFESYQRLTTDAAQAWESFVIDDEFFLAVANYGQNAGVPTNSTIFKWMKRKRKFKEHQHIVTSTARDFEFFSVDGSHYLAVANHALGSNQVTDSFIYQWNPTSGLFEEFQAIETVGAYDWTYFTAEGYHFLALAQAFDGSSTLIHSRIYILQNKQFLVFQTMETNGATDWEVFSINNVVFLAVANAYNYGPQNRDPRRRHATNSTVYRLSVSRRHFERFQDIETYSAVDWEYFQIENDHFLVVSNAQNGGSTNEFRTSLYRWQGLDRFVKVHSMYTEANSDWEIFKQDGKTYFVCTNAKGRYSYIYRAKLKY